MSHVVTVPELLDGHTVLDIECPDRIYLNGYVPTLQVGGQVLTFLRGHPGMPVASPAVFEKIGTRFRQAVARFAQVNDIPVIRFKKGIRKIDVMQRYLRGAALAGRPGVARSGGACTWCCWTGPPWMRRTPRRTGSIPAGCPRRMPGEAAARGVPAGPAAGPGRVRHPGADRRRVRRLRDRGEDAHRGAAAAPSAGDAGAGRPELRRL